MFSKQLEIIAKIGQLTKIGLHVATRLKLSDMVKALSHNKALFKGNDDSLVTCTCRNIK